jgi:hypothetical protein
VREPWAWMKPRPASDLLETIAKDNLYSAELDRAA